MLLLNSFTSNQINKLQKFFNVHGASQLKQILTNCSDELFVAALYLCLLNRIPSNVEIDGDRLLLTALDREKLINRFHSIRSTSNTPDAVDYPIVKELPVIVTIVENSSLVISEPTQPPIKKSKVKSNK